MKKTLMGMIGNILPPRVKKSLVHLAYQVDRNYFAAFGHTYCISPDMESGLRIIAARGFSPNSIVDVGAFEGGWTRLATRVWPNASVTMVEANRAKMPMLQQLGDARCALLGAECGREVTFNVMETGSSVFAENSSIARDCEIRTTETLDSLSIPIAAPVLLKIDAQGYELEILKGASKSLPHYEAILLEVALVEMNKGAPLLHEVVAFMNNLGYRPCEILETHRRPTDKALSQIDILFARRKSPLLMDKTYC